MGWGWAARRGGRGGGRGRVEEEDLTGPGHCCVSMIHEMTGFNLKHTNTQYSYMYSNI